MFSLQQLLSKDERFFDLLEASAEQACLSISCLVQLLKQPGLEQSLDAFVETRRKDKKITEELSALLCKSFVTPLEREDIEALSVALYKIPKTVEKFGERLLISRKTLSKVDFLRHTEILQHTTTSLLTLVKSLRGKPSLEVVKEHNIRLQQLEGEADKLMLDLLKDLFDKRQDPLQIIILRDLYELLEKVVDRCRDAGNIVFHIVLKHS